LTYFVRKDIMREFDYINASSIDEALDLLSNDGCSKIIAGGTDLITGMKNNIVKPERLINIKKIPDLDNVTFDSALKIGALAILDRIEKNEIVKQRFSILEQAISQVATPQIRNMATIGGNLCQRPRCLYYRHPQFNCLRKGGKTCFAVKGENRYHAIVGGPCFMVHPSDLAIPLIALDACVVIAGIDSRKTIPLKDFFSRDDIHKENILETCEILTEIQIPEPLPSSKGVYLKAMERKAWDFAIVSVAAQISFNDKVVQDARIVFGGIAPIPWRAYNAESILKGNTIGEEICDEIGESMASEFRPLKHNSYKAAIAKSLVKKALLSAQTFSS